MHSILINIICDLLALGSKSKKSSVETVSAGEKTPTRQLLNRDDLRRRRQQLKDIGAYKKNTASQDSSDSEVNVAAYD